jgi:gamma-glutamyltranspeptidase/glutathione hydrolase
LNLINDSYSSKIRPVLQGLAGAVSAAHPLAVAAGQELLRGGGSAADAAIAAQAVLCVVAPDACGLGGDMFALVHAPGGDPVAINASGAAPMALSEAHADGANSITVPGIVDGWRDLSDRWGRVPLARCLEPAIHIARAGFRVTGKLAATVTAQRDRLLRGGADSWALLGLSPGQVFTQDRLADLLEAIGRDGGRSFYEGDAATAIADTVGHLGGALAAADFAAHRTEIRAPIVTRLGDVTVATQPPMAQGVLLSMALSALDRLGPIPDELGDHVGVELTEAAFAFRARAGEGEALLGETLSIDFSRAGLRGGPRAYLHTAGVAVSDREGLTISSLVSVFDDFGSCVFVPDCGITLNNRAGGFTDGPNAAAPGKRPVHTLAPALLMLESGSIGLATPGADGQVQTLLQVITAVLREDVDLAQAIARPRWRSEGGALLIEESHPGAARLRDLGHRVRPLADGDTRFGAVVCAGRIDGAPIAVSDWRRDTWSGVA